jgi:two-component system chemotaxis response regulator CheB
MAERPRSRHGAGKLRVLVVDDSALIRKLLSQIIDAEADMEVAGVAPDAPSASHLIRTLVPDVLTLDVEMPGMNGIDFLEELMQRHPMPVLMVSALTERGSQAALRALELGAVDFVAKPKLTSARGLSEAGAEIVAKLRIAARARPRPTRIAPMLASRTAETALAARSKSARLGKSVVVVGASTGGTEAIKELLARLAPDAPGVLIAQHMPEAFTRSFAARLNDFCRLQVREAVDGEKVLSGCVYVAPGHSHLLLERNGATYVTRLSQAPAVNRHRPSVDVLFRSAARCAGEAAVGVLLTGMGKDGAQGLLELRQAGAHTIAQDEASCVVFGMPREAIGLDAAVEVAPLHEIARRIVAHLVPSSEAGTTVQEVKLASADRRRVPDAAHWRDAFQTNVEPNGGKVKIRLNGRFDFSAHRAFRESYAASLSDASVSEVEIDLGAVDYMDSSALGMLLMLREKAQAAKKSVTLANCLGSVRQLLDVAKFGKLFAMR